MKVFIPKPDWQYPTMCASCGSVLSGQFIEHYISVKSKNANYNVKRKLPYFRCKECNTFLNEVKRFYRPQIKNGFWIGFLVGALLYVSLIVILLLKNPNRQELLSALPKAVYAALILAFLLLGEASGWAGRQVALHRLFWGKTLPEKLRERIQRILKPIEVKQFMAYEEQKGFVTIKDQQYFGYIVLNLANVHFAKALIESNAGEILTLYCAKCGKELEEEKGFQTLKGWSASVCSACGNLYCPDCLDHNQPTSCLDCGKPLLQAGREEIQAANLFSDYAANAFLGEFKSN
jgi:hypothetical protein